MGHLLHPRAVVEDLGDYLPRCPVSLELDDVEVALVIKAEQVNSLPVRRDDLAADQEDVKSQDGDIFGEEILKSGFLVEPSKGESAGAAVIDPPHSDLKRHTPRLTVGRTDQRHPATSLTIAGRRAPATGVLPDLRESSCVLQLAPRSPDFRCPARRTGQAWLHGVPKGPRHRRRSSHGRQS